MVDINGGLSETECRVLGEVAEASGATRALEVGHWQGLSTAVLLEHLPARCSLTTVDHHLGDGIMKPFPVGEFMANIAPYLKHRPFTFHYLDMMAAIPELGGGYDFVFYDADHAYPAFSMWWAAIEPTLAAHCTLVYDDADWEDQGKLSDLAEADGFVTKTQLSYKRENVRDKRNRKDYTLAVLVRE